MARLVNPWPAGYSINKRSPYGFRIHPITGRRTFHHGVDVAGSFPVSAGADGRVIKVGWSPSGGGHTVLIDHGDLVTVYYHGAHKTALTVGQEVRAGDFIYTSGNTGASTGAHLHFECRNPGGKWGDTQNPADFLPTPGERPQTAVSAPEGVSGTSIADDAKNPSNGVVRPPFLPKPMSPGLKRFFDIQKALKGIR